MTIYWLNCKIWKKKRKSKNKNSWYYFFLKRMIGPSCTWHFLWLSASLCDVWVHVDFLCQTFEKSQILFILTRWRTRSFLFHFVCLFFLSMFIIPFLKVISELRYFCFNSFYNVTVLHYNSILWEELLRNKKKLLCGRTVHSPNVSVSLDLFTLSKEKDIIYA